MCVNDLCSFFAVAVDTIPDSFFCRQETRIRYYVLGAYSLEFLVGCSARFFKPWPDFRPKNVVFHTCFQTRPLKSIPVFRPGLKGEIMLSLLRLGRKQKNSSNPFRIRIFIFLSHSFGIETINTFIHSRSSLENHTRFQTKIGKVFTRFQTKTAQNHYPMGAAHTYMAYIREYPRVLC